MSTSEVVKRLCHQFSDDALSKQAAEWAASPLSTCRDIISTVKKVIKDRREIPAHRLMALKGNREFLKFAGKKIMQRLTILGTHKKAVRDPNRGEDIFGPISLVSEQSRAASAEFLHRLLTYIRIWSQEFGTDADGAPSAFRLAYQKLLGAMVAFPQEGGAEPVRSLSPRCRAPKPFTQDELESVSTSAQLLNDLQSQPDSDRETVSQLKSQLAGVPARIEAELGLKTGQSGMEDYVSQLIELNDYVRSTLLRSEAGNPMRRAVSQASSSSDEEELAFQRALSASLLPAHLSDVARDPAGLEAELAVKQERLKSLNAELEKAKRDEVECERSVDDRRKANLQVREDGEQRLKALVERQELEILRKTSSIAGSARLKDQLGTAQKQLADLRSALREKEDEHRALQRSLTSAQEENQRLSSALSSSDPSHSPLADEFDSFHPSVSSLIPSLVPPLVLKPGVAAYAQRPADNAEFLLLCGLNSKGVLYSNQSLEVGFMFRQPYTMLLYIGNKGKEDMRQVRTFVCDFPSAGLSLTINKEIEDLPVAYMGKVNRSVAIKVSDCISSRGAEECTLNLLLPITVLRYMQPQHADAGAWNALAAYSAAAVVPPQFLPSLSLSPPLAKTQTAADATFAGTYEGEPVLVLVEYSGTVTVRCQPQKLRDAVLEVLRQILQT